MGQAASQSYRDLIVWQKAHRFVLDLYAYTKNFPKEEMFVLIPQLRRAAISVPSNIAEGYRKRGKADKARFFNTSEGSLEECDYQLFLAQDLGYGDSQNLRNQLAEISKMLRAYSAAVLNS